MNKDSIFLFWLGYMRILLVFFLLLGLSGCLYQQINNQPNLPDNVDQTNEKEEEGWNIEFRENFFEVGIGEADPPQKENRPVLDSKFSAEILAD